MAEIMGDWQAISKPGAITDASLSQPTKRYFYYSAKHQKWVNTSVKPQGGYIAYLWVKSRFRWSPALPTKQLTTGLHIQVDEKEMTLDVDSVIICAGQEPNKVLYYSLVETGLSVHVIGGADVAAELDAKRALSRAELAAVIWLTRCRAKYSHWGKLR